MNGKDIELTRRRVLFTIIVIGLASLAAGAGTMAYFSDSETSNDNTVQAGTLDLAIDGGDANVSLLTVGNAKPGDSGSNKTTLANEGSVDGNLTVALAVDAAENNQTEPESGLDAEQEGVVELNESGMNVTVALDTNGDGAVNQSEWNVTGTPADIQGTYSNVTSLAASDPTTASDSTTLLIEYEIPNETGNEIQTDSVTIDATITLEQSAN